MQITHVYRFAISFAERYTVYIKLNKGYIIINFQSVCVIVEGGVFIGYIFVPILLAAAVMYDLHTYRIPNIVNAAGGILGIAGSTALYGIKGLGMSLIGIVVPVICLFVFFGYHVVGAGDIKLLAAVGSFVHIDIIRIMGAAFIITALYGVGIFLIRLVNAVKFGLKGAESISVKGRASENVAEADRFTKIHLSVPITLATVIIMFGGLWI